MTHDHFQPPRSAPVQALMVILAWVLLLGFAPGILGAEPDHVPGEILVQFREDASVLGVQQALANRPGQQRLTDRVSRVSIRPGETVEQVIIELESLSDVEFAEPNYIRRIQLTPNDPFFGQQWGLHNTGQSLNVSDSPSGTPGLDIDAVAAWDITTGSREVIVAIIDSGIDLDHPELVDNLWVDPITGNRGRDFLAGGEPQDNHGHGTAMAGIIGARGDNGIGIAGVAWEVSLMALRAIRSDGTATVSTIVQAIDYAVENGADVINGSFGEMRNPSQTEREAIERAGQRGVTFVAAACNFGEDNDTVSQDGQQSPCYPASYDLPNIISVAATDNSDGLQAQSNYGAESVHLGAPGEHVLSLSLGFTPGGEIPLAFHTGTSAAAAMVSGALALVLTRNPDLAPIQLRDLLMDTADPASNLASRTRSGGRLNVARALQEAEGIEAQSASASPTRFDGGSGRLDLPALAVLLAFLGLWRLQQWKYRR